MIDKNVLIVLFALWLAVSLLLLVDYLTRRSRSAKVSTAKAEQSETATAAAENEASTSEAVDRNAGERTLFEIDKTNETTKSVNSKRKKENVSAGAEKSKKASVKNRSEGDTKTADSQIASTSNDARRSEKVAAEYPEVEETACAAVTKGSNGSSSRRGKLRRSKRNKAKAAAVASQAQSDHRETSETVTSGTNGTPPATTSENADDTGTTAMKADDRSARIDPSDSLATNSTPDALDAPSLAQQDASEQDASEQESSQQNTLQEQDQAPVEANPDRGESPLTVAILLEDVELPFDLHSASGGEPDEDRHVLFVSSHSHPEAVGTAFADELERVGFVIEPAGFDEAVAKRNGHTLTLRITPDAGASDRYPYLDANDVAIETWIL